MGGAARPAHRATSLPPTEREQKSHRSSSVPARNPGLDDDQHDFSLMNLGLGFSNMERDQRAWAEILEEEKAEEADEAQRCEEDLFEQLQQEERRRLMQAELASSN